MKLVVMKYGSKWLWVIIGLLTCLCSCKEYLDLKPYGEVIPKTPEEFEALLNNRLNNIDYANGDVALSKFDAGDYECFADNLDANLTQYPEGTGLPVYVGDKVAGINGSNSDYAKLYEYIRDCNLIIENMEEEQTERGVKVIATAYALRAVCYYNLLRMFCEPVDKNASGQLGLQLMEKFDMEAKPLRSDMQTTLSFIERDLLKAISYNLKDEKYRFTVDVVKAYLVKLYFWAQNWGEVITRGEELLKVYPLLSGEVYKEMVTSRHARKGNVLIRSYIYGPDQDATADLTIRFRPVSKKFVDLFKEKERDIRYEISFNKKRQIQKPMNAQVRSAEIALMVMEAYAHQTNGQVDALRLLNEFRTKRIEGNVPYTFATLPQETTAGLISLDATGKTLTPLLVAIFKERQKELFMEGDRWFELKRNGRPEFWVAKDGYKHVTQKFMYTFPLPRYDVELITGLIQNDGYQL